jgi:cytochrome b561
MMGLPSDEIEARARIAELELQIHLKSHGEIGEILKTAFNWLYPTLVTLNSGALFMLASNIEKFDRAYAGLAGLSFCGGIFFALLIAYRVIRRAAKGRKFLAPFIEQASLRTIGSDIEIETDALEKQAKSLNRGEVISAIVGWSSFGCFVLGLAFIWSGVALVERAPSASTEPSRNERVAGDQQKTQVLSDLTKKSPSD